MNLLYLKYAVEVARTTSITKAAEALYMGQPNLSRAIKDLEEELGIKIFKRTSKGIVPTEEGEEFLGYARSILSRWTLWNECTRASAQTPSCFPLRCRARPIFPAHSRIL